MNKIKTIIILLMTAIAFHLQAEVIPPEEFRSLKLIYDGIENTDKATLLSGWDINRTDNDVTNWEGITVTDGHITAIDLSGKGLRADLYSLEGFSNDPSAFTPLGYERYCFLWMQKLKSLNLSNNNFYGSFPRLGFVRVGYPVKSYMYDLEELIINDNDFIQILSVLKECTKLKTINAENNRFMSFSVHGIPPLEKINFSNNMLSSQNFLISQWKKTDMPVLTVKELDISHNGLNFGSLWWFSDPQGEYYGDIYDGFGNLVEEGKPDEYWNILYEPGVTVVYAPQDSVVMKSVNAHKVRSTVGGSFFVALPDVGQRNDGLWYQYPEIIDSLDFQWYKDGIALAADTFPDLTRETVTAEDFGRYYCEIKSKSDRLKDLVLYTESFWVVNEENQPPVISITSGQQTQRIKAGQMSPKVRLNVTDDIVWDGQSTVRDRGFEITQYPKHLQYIDGYFSEIQVQSTDPMWTGRDSIEVSYCDYEGACGSIKLYYEVYDDLYSPDIIQVTA
ncbi:MAG: hypothetical protein LBR75_01570, partial [Prevotellaceae bacterium]|nr:hypothetical protein [Prevotellaceae bacterium]